MSTQHAAGFDYQFNAIRDESNELFTAYKEMFEIAVSQQGGGLWELAILYAPILDRFMVCASGCRSHYRDVDLV